MRLRFCKLMEYERKMLIELSDPIISMNCMSLDKCLSCKLVHALIVSLFLCG